jgi:hyperosmotically inducible periplasmic protein
MNKTYGWVLVTFTVLGVGFWAASARSQQEGVAEKAGEKIDEVGRAIKDGIGKAGDSVREGFNRTRDSVQAMGILPRVYGRIHWDKALHASSIVLKGDGGVITLRGMVSDEAARTKAVTLAAETVGVTRVIDQLMVLTSTTTQPSRPATKR